MKKLLLFSLLLALFAFSTAPDVPALAQGGREDTTAILARLGGYPCPDSDFTCVNLTVPLDHTDPATPVSNGERVYRRLADGYLVTTEGGAHVIFGRGDACPDDLVTAFLVDDQLPAQRETRCEGVVANLYAPLIPASAADFVDPLDALSWVDDEIYYLPEYYFWDLETPTSVGCPYGGTLSFVPSDVGEALTLAGCAFSDGFVMTGSGTYDYEAGRFSLDVAISGLANGNLIYTREDDGAIQVKGTYAGQAVDLSS